ncbi:MAG: hypothetical protein WBM62_17490 [Crocosphaera sp.]|jgi:hypothetical protein
MNIKPGDVVTIGNQVGLVCAIRGKLVILRQFRFTPGGQWRGCFDREYPLELVKPASEYEINSIHNQAIRAVKFYRFAVPRKIFLMIAGKENHE